jgi:hypothetical protein
MSVPADLPRWRRALALAVMIAGILLVCAAPVAEMLGLSWAFFVGGLVGGALLGFLAALMVAQRITCERCGGSIVSVGGRPRLCPVRNCLRCGAPFFGDGSTG